MLTTWLVLTLLNGDAVSQVSTEAECRELVETVRKIEAAEPGMTLAWAGPAGDWEVVAVQCVTFEIVTSEGRCNAE